MNLREWLVRLIAVLRQVIRVERNRGKPVVIDGRLLVPVTRAVRIQWADREGGAGFVWNHPVAMLEEIGDGIYRKYPIRDTTLQTAATLLASALAVRVLLALLFPRRS
jgi:hypothetical protein